MPLLHIVGHAVGPHAGLDHVLLIVVAVLLPLADWLWLYPRLVRASAAGVPGARWRFYAVGMLTLWGIAAVVAAFWAVRDRSWGAIGLGAGPWSRLGVGLGLAVLFVALLQMQRRSVLATPKLQEALRRQFS